MAELSLKEKYTELVSERLTLLRPTIADETFLRQVFSFNDIWQFISTYHISEKHIQDKIKKYTTIIDSNGGFIWKIEIDSKSVGIISLHNWNIEHQKAELGYFILPQYQRKGIVSEAVHVVLGHIFKNHLLNRIEAIVYEENEPSNQFMMKQGFTREALLRDYMEVRNQFVNIYLYSILKKEWQQ